MKYSYQKIEPALAAYVQTALVFDNSSDIENTDLPLFTAGMPALFCRAGKVCNQITIFGHSVPEAKWVIGDSETLVAFFFKPFALGTIFNLSAKTLKKKAIELNAWNAQKAIAVNIQLLHTKSTLEKFQVLEHLVLTQIATNRYECEIIRHATDALMENSGADSLSRLLQELNLAERTFQRIFKKYTGITPNEYRRICQFYFAFAQLKGGYFDKLTDVAYANGYFDQSHYIRSFKEFTDITPNNYLKLGLPGTSE